MIKVCVVVNSRANYGRVKSVMQAIRRHPLLTLQLVVGGSAVLSRYGLVERVMKEDGFTPDAEVHSLLEGENLLSMAKSTGHTIVELTSVFDHLKPDWVVVVADRFEQLAVAIAASYQNIRIAHIQGGEITGSIDESVRHAITKLSHLHLCATERAKSYVIRMGENPLYVINTGCPSIDLAKTVIGQKFHGFPAGRGVGPELDADRDFLMVMQHPVTTEFGSGRAQIEETLRAIENTGMQTVWLWPNVDAGADDISKRLRQFHETNPKFPIRFYTNLRPEQYYNFMLHCRVLVGNSSSGIREGAYLGTPVVNIGTRQQFRERHINVMDVGYSAAKITQAIRQQLQFEDGWPMSLLYGMGDAGERIAQCLAIELPPIQKGLFYEL